MGMESGGAVDYVSMGDKVRVNNGENGRTNATEQQ